MGFKPTQNSGHAFVFGFVSGLIAASAFAADDSFARTPPQATRVPLVFFENQGQIDPQVQFAGRAGGLATFFTRDAFTVRLAETVDVANGESAAQGVTLRYNFDGASSDVKVTGDDLQKGVVNFFKGNDPSRWHTGIPTYAAVRYAGMYPGVDVVVRDHAGGLEYDLVLAPGASLDQVKIRCEGADGLRVDADGSLIATTPYGELKQRFPQTWQLDSDGNRKAVDSRFVLLSDDTYGFAAPDRDPSAGAVVDPSLTYASYLGGSDSEHGCGVDVDDACDLYITGDTLSVDFPVTAGAFDKTYNLDFDVFVAKVESTGNILDYSTYVGGTLGDFGHGIRVIRSTGEAYFTGGTKSTDFPTTVGAFDTTQNGQGDTFVTKIGANGHMLLYSTFLGGSDEEGSLGGQGLAITQDGSCWVAGFTGSPNFPVTSGAVDTTFNGPVGVADAFCTQLSPDGSQVRYSTFVGGSSVDIANAIDIDEFENPYFAGWSASNDYPTSPGAFATVPNGSSNGFLTKLVVNPDGTSTIGYSTFMGGSSEVVRGVAVVNGIAVATGYTLSSVFPATPTAFDTSPDGNGDGFVSRFNATGTQVIYASYLGGIQTDVGNAIDEDENGSAYISGWTESVDFPATATAFDNSYNGAEDCFVTRVAPDGTTLEYSTFIGGSDFDVGFSMNVHMVGSVYVVGGTRSTDFPVTPGTYDTTENGLEDVFYVLLPAGAASCPAGAAMSTYGTGKADSNGNVPQLTANTLPTVPSTHSLNINLTNATPNATTVLLFGNQPGSFPFDSGTILVTPLFALQVPNTDPSGNLTLGAPVSDNPNFCGKTLFLQAIVIDRNLPTFYNASLSNGLSLTFGN